MPEARRPIKARNTRWAAAMAGGLARSGMKPNHISVLSAVFAAGSGIVLAATGVTAPVVQPWLLRLNSWRL